MKIYTKTGDKGYTGLYDGKRVSKTSHIFTVLGEIDELSTRIGQAYCILGIKEEFIMLRHIQRILQDINSVIATIDKNIKVPKIDPIIIIHLENLIDIMDKDLKPLKEFILPSTSINDSYIHLCRTQTRKVERELWKLIETKEREFEDDTISKFFNRLSDYFFMLARFINEK